MATHSEESREGVKSAHRALMVLELLAQHDGPMTFAEIGDALGYPRSSLFALLNTLESLHWLMLDQDTRRYSLGIRTLEAGNAYLRSLNIVEISRRPMERIRDMVGETVQLSVLDGRFNVYIGKVEGTQALRLASEVGRRLPAHCTGVGKALLADLDANEFDQLMDGVTLERYTDQTFSDLEALKAELAEIRARGYSTDNAEHTLGVRCVALPIRDAGGRATAAISISLPSVRYTQERGELARAMLVEAAEEISSRLGYRPSSQGFPAPHRPGVVARDR